MLFALPGQLDLKGDDAAEEIGLDRTEVGELFGDDDEQVVFGDPVIFGIGEDVDVSGLGLWDDPLDFPLFGIWFCSLLLLLLLLVLLFELSCNPGSGSCGFKAFLIKIINFLS